MPTIYKRGRLRADKIAYKDGVGICMWFPLASADGEDEDCGLCWDIAGSDLDDLINLMLDVREAEAEPLEE